MYLVAAAFSTHYYFVSLAPFILPLNVAIQRLLMTMVMMRTSQESGLTREIQAACVLSRRVQNDRRMCVG